MGPSRQCEVCKETASKYKCPSCLLPYCSLVCFKKHKETPCKVAPPPSENIGKFHTALPKRSYQVGEESWVLKKQQLRSLVDCQEIHDSLKNEEIRNLIQAIDSSEFPEDDLTKAMKGELFLDFTNKILSIISPEE
ncbi:unnamed protein product [Spirodela intermedia]|uniref:Zinc finger HIT domain-containing protein 3 n=2 Tax=Spirodela intermedia TaxID=51605 RepID=A0A7I8KMF0_SPIIN|nr:unnamed protein product [Spirodela intermedia]CAA6662565.1 unnamed protein product [Spirodela intermedia]CAA7398969.1 unnamed protein product [Spirodela intermedia]